MATVASVPPAEVRKSGLRRRLIALDTVSVGVSWGAALVGTGGMPSNLLRGAAGLCAVTLVTLLALGVEQLYRKRIATVRAEEVARLVPVAALSGTGAVVIAELGGVRLSATTVAVGVLAVFGSLVYVRGRFAHWLQDQRAAGRYMESVVVLGEGEEADALVQLLEECPEVGFRPIGAVGLRPTACRVPWLGEASDVVGIARRSGATGVIVSSGSLGSGHLNRIVRELHHAGIHVHVSSGLALFARRRLRVQPVAHEPLLYVEPQSLSHAQIVAKRVLDIVAASIALVVLAPVLGVAALAVKSGDGGPVLFRQWRVGRDGRHFRILKLRTMVVDAERQLDAVRDRNERNGPLFKLTNDPRVTRIGGLLRATSIDEIPQLLNVLRGDMSMVGPRPALPEEVAQFDDDLLQRLAVRPGVTGLWQVEARHKASYDQYRRLDLFYVENWSVCLDVSILLATVSTILRRVHRNIHETPSDGAERVAEAAVRGFTSVSELPSAMGVDQYSNATTEVVT